MAGRKDRESNRYNVQEFIPNVNRSECLNLLQMKRAKKSGQMLSQICVHLSCNDVTYAILNTNLLHNDFSHQSLLRHVALSVLSHLQEARGFFDVCCRC